MTKPCPNCQSTLIEATRARSNNLYTCMDCSTQWRADEDSTEVRELVVRNEPVVFHNGITAREWYEDWKARR